MTKDRNDEGTPTKDRNPNENKERRRRRRRTSAEPSDDAERRTS
eukprot:CAMPEP_0197173872 /NCGR_PEP_ID=MMETSP1423-20130617/634_1 /TAXON_ID=476441 /ORGANISM="Pseudo-nitzschia heimii, Strain UNC1101" /LENGTH=43 /DNA_ID= /DNA_START= /DNA_END= /DNA_ORIENTATION=